ncbi:hypothetical protein [Streptomyces sp. NPDC048442]|uniref:hypothetical protein n=1 Tax=Streptomyces sp. NPDC048442 TaxID=3154823 RepID=UPI003427462A
MGDISIERQALPRLLADHTHQGTCYQQAFNTLAATHRGRPATAIVPLLRQAADEALLGFSTADLHEQAYAISTGAPYQLRITLT